MDAHEFLRNLALVLCAAAFTAVVFQRLRLPIIFGYLAAGMLVGPHLPIPLVADERMIHALSELGVILLMYSLGLEFSFRKLMKIGATAGVAALAETTMMFGLGYALAGILGWSAIEQAFTGAIVAISSTTVIARTFAEQGVHGKLREIVFGILIVEDLIAILLIAILSAIAAGGGVSIAAIGLTGIRLATFLAVLITVGLLILPRMMRFIVDLNRKETTLIAGVGICFAAALLALAFGYSVALGAFIAGSLVAESGHGHQIEKLIEPIRDMFVAIFFVAVGMLIDPSVLAEHWGAVLAVTALVLIGKIVSVSMGVFLTGNSLPKAVRSGMSLAQIGEFSFIIAGVGVAAGAIRPFLYPVAIAASAITSLTTPILVRRADLFSQQVDRVLPHALQTFVSLYGTWMEQLRSGNNAGGSTQTTRLLRLVLLDVLVLIGLIVAAGAERGRLAVLMQGWFGLSVRASDMVVVLLAVIAAIPFIVGLVRMTRALATVLAVRALPAPSSRLDRAEAPRRALIATLHFGILMGFALPVIAVLQLFVPRLSALGVLLALLAFLGFAVWRSAGNLYGHARAGAEVIVMALTQHDRARASEAELTQTMEHVATMLPGLGHPGAVRLSANSPAVGRTLGELDLRGITGATVLAITRQNEKGAQAIVPTGKERLRDGDLLALAGTEEGVAMARRLLAGTELLAMQDAHSLFTQEMPQPKSQ
jgi:CPA2 family monovalent cation:H+ antiporter-2